MAAMLISLAKKKLAESQTKENSAVGEASGSKETVRESLENAALAQVGNDSTASEAKKSKKAKKKQSQRSEQGNSQLGSSQSGSSQSTRTTEQKAAKEQSEREDGSYNAATFHIRGKALTAKAARDAVLMSEIIGPPLSKRKSR